MTRSGVMVGAVSLVLSLTSCNQPPVIRSVGDYLIADSIADYLNPDFGDNAYFYASEGVELTFAIVAEDPDGDPVTYSAGPLPRGALFDDQTGVFSWTPEADQRYDSGLEVYMVAQDPHGGWDSVVVYVQTYEEPEY
jgi:hypothetical protein